LIAKVAKKSEKSFAAYRRQRWRSRKVLPTSVWALQPSAESAWPFTKLLCAAWARKAIACAMSSGSGKARHRNAAR